MGNLRIPKDVTRVDLERIPDEDAVIVCTWSGEWQPGTAPAHKEILQSASLITLLEGLEKLGFTVEMADADLGRALRGRITRIDFLGFPDQSGWAIKRYPYGWTAKTRPIQVDVVDTFDFQTHLAWLIQHGWTVREWGKYNGIPAGCRAFYGQPVPVRTASAIRDMRRRHGDKAPYDFSFDC